MADPLLKHPMPLGPEIDSPLRKLYRLVARYGDRSRADDTGAKRWISVIAATLLLAPMMGLLKLNGGPGGAGIQSVAGHWFVYKTLVTGDPSGHTVVDLGNNSRVELTAGATFAYRRQLSSQGIASLTGDAILHIQPRLGDIALLLPLDSTAWSPSEFLARAKTRGVPSDAALLTGVRLDVIDLAPGLYRVHTFGGDSTVVDIQIGTMRALRGSTPQGGGFHDGDHVVITAVGFISYRP